MLEAQEPDSSSALFRMRESERSFAKSSAMYGTKHAFVEFLNDFSLIYTNGWIKNGKDHWSKREPSPQILKWEPEYMDISLSRDFGVSTGPWEAQEYRPNTRPLGTGYFLSVWVAGDDGRWKVQLDAGINCPPPPDEKKHSFSFPPGNDRPVVNKPRENHEAKILMEEEMKMLDLWKKKPSYSTWSSFLEKDSRIMRKGHSPSQNPDTLRKWIEEDRKLLTWEAQGSAMARSADLGYTYGIVESKGKKGNFVRIWKKNAEGEWKITIDMFNID
ncbi:MAG TPA: hypothetical protein VK207_07435 [Bacteroidales bacterium]|nr:hypothetical protein [Bacteroidales bacterium]